jgi:hypothetical protein
MPFANQNAFDDPGHKVIAQGYSFHPKTTIWLDPNGREQALTQSGGMINPERCELRAGTTLYKYTDQAQSADIYLSSGWWFARRQLDHIIAFAQQEGVPEGYAVRLLGCVPPEWGSLLDLVVGVSLSTDLLAFRGLAKSAVGRDAHGRTAIEAQNENPNLRLPQLYVPGLRDARTNRPTGRHMQWFQDVKRWPVRNPYTWIYRGTR